MTLPDSELAVFPRRTLEAALLSSREAGLSVIGSCATPLETSKRGSGGSSPTGSVPQRVAGLLLRLADEWGKVGTGGRIALELPLTRTEMAESLGAPRESVSRALSALVKRGVISLEGDHLTILEPDLLRRRSGAWRGPGP